MVNRLTMEINLEMEFITIFPRLRRPHTMTILENDIFTLWDD